MANDEEVIRKLVETWFAANKKGDIATMLDLLAEDVIFMMAALVFIAAVRSLGMTSSQQRTSTAAANCARLAGVVEAKDHGPGGNDGE